MSATPDSTLANPEQLIADLQRQLAESEAQKAGSEVLRGLLRARRNALDRRLWATGATA